MRIVKKRKKGHLEVMVHYKLILKGLLALVLLSGLTCIPNLRKPQEPQVLLAHQDAVYRFALLLRDNKMKVRVQPRTRLPYSHNSSTGVWIGTEFPFEQAIKAILLSRNYYKDLRYLALSDRETDRPKEVHKQLFLGGATETALRLKLRAWSKKEIAGLVNVRTKKELHELVRAHYAENYKEPKKKGSRKRRRRKRK